MNDLKPMLRKVPAVTIFFWIAKVLTTAMGESTSDYLVHAISPVAAVGIGAIGFAAAMAWQLLIKRYVAWVYWFAVAMVAVFGTMAADVVHIGLGVPYVYSTLFFSASLLVVFGLWYKTEGTLSIHSIDTPRRELFYWATVCATFALGTAAGDMAAISLTLGYLASGIWFGGVIAAIVAAHYGAQWIRSAERRRLARDPVLAFWLAYILTRPLGASFADWMGKPSSLGGLGWGDGPVSIALAALIIIVVAYLSATKADVEEERPLLAEEMA